MEIMEIWSALQPCVAEVDGALLHRSRHALTETACQPEVAGSMQTTNMKAMHVHLPPRKTFH